MNNLQIVKTRTQDLMRSLGRAHLGEPLQDRGWTFRFDRAVRRLGACKWHKDGSTRILSLSRHYALEQGWATMEDVARHEIAHALDYETRDCSDHGPTWQQWARRCGADPSRLYEGDPLSHEQSRYVGRCPSCGTEYPYYRKLRRAHACVACCRKYAGGRYDERFRLTLVERATGREVAVPAAPRANTRRAKYTGTCPNCGDRIVFARRVKRSYACKKCCDRYNGGRFDARFVYTIMQHY